MTTWEKAVKEVSKELGIPENVVKAAYLSAWKFVVRKIQELPLKEDLTDEEFNKLRTNFNMPSLCKIYVTGDMYRRTKRMYSYIKKFIGLKEKERKDADIQDSQDKAGVQSGDNDKKPV